MSTEPRIGIHDFSARTVDQNIYFRVVRMKDSLLIWIGDRTTFTDLAVAMPTRFETMPITTKLLGPVDKLSSGALSQKIAKRCNKQCFVSYNLPIPLESTKGFVEERLLEELKTHPEKF